MHGFKSIKIQSCHSHNYSYDFQFVNNGFGIFELGLLVFTSFTTISALDSGIISLSLIACWKIPKPVSRSFGESENTATSSFIIFEPFTVSFLYEISPFAFHENCPVSASFVRVNRQIERRFSGTLFKINSEAGGRDRGKLSFPDFDFRNSYSSTGIILYFLKLILYSQSENRIERAPSSILFNEYPTIIGIIALNLIYSFFSLGIEMDLSFLTKH